MDSAYRNEPNYWSRVEDAEQIVVYAMMVRRDTLLQRIGIEVKSSNVPRA
jgi:hypothetical protein